jgi:TolB-like protein
MYRSLMLSIGSLLWIMLGNTAAVAGRAATGAAGPGPPATLAVADFQGADELTSGFLAEMLMTALNQSAGLRLVECVEVRQACSDLHLDTSGIRDPEQVRRLGERVGVDHLVVGSYRESDQHIVINARLLNVASGRPVPGCSGSVEGSSKELVVLAGNLARKIQEHVTGHRLQELAPEPPSSTEDRQSDASPGAPPERAEGAVTESDLAKLVARLGRERGARTTPSVTVQHPPAPVTRLRALAALVKLLVAPAELATSAAPREALPPDASQVPAWGLPYVAAAVEQGLFSPDEPLRARATATWEFVHTLVARLPTTEREPEGNSYTGVIVDARDFGAQRAMGPRIMDEDGNVLYPDPRHVPSPDALQIEGMVSYATSLRSMRRTGANPFIVTAIDVTGPAHEDVVVSRAAARQILQIDRRWRCLARRAVGILIAPRE